MTVAGVGRFRALPEAEGRVLLLINAFSGTPSRPRELEGRVKLAKIDFLIRYPTYLVRVLRLRGVPETTLATVETDRDPLEDRMIRYRYGPWDPAYYAVLGSLIGRGLVEALPVPRGIGYRATLTGRALAHELRLDESWADVDVRARLAKRHLDKAGSTLKALLYEAIPEMTNATWRQELD